MKRTAVFYIAGLGIVLAACGSLDSNTNSAPELATLRGSLSNTRSIDLSNPSAVRVAVVWRGNGPGRFNVAEDLPVRPVFPASFTIGFDGPPPAEAMNSEDESPASPPPSSFDTSGGGSAPASSEGGLETAAQTSSSLVLLDTSLKTGAAFRYAFGTVVAYLDQNHNGKLDLVGDNATAYVDQILAANQEMSIVYLEGTIPEPAGMPVVDSAGNGPKDGYNLFRVPICNTPMSAPINPECPVAAPDAGPCAPSAWLGIDTPYPLSIATNPVVSRLMCLTTSSGPPSSNSGTGAGPGVQPAQYPSPTDPNLCCVAGGTSYIYATCVENSQGLCKGTIESCTSVGYDRPTPTPSGWPCMN